MSDREKKLLIFLGIAGFLILNFVAFNFYQQAAIRAQSARKAAEQKLANTRVLIASKEQILAEMQWLAEHQPDSMPSQDVQTRLQQLVSKEALAASLSVGTQKFLPTDATPGNAYHRAKFQISVSGREEALYRWFNQLNDPAAFRAATHIKLSPNKTDDTLIDCSATIEQWFIPPA
ncbi:MAG: hypothetical protein QM627_03850 [Luteolibacter sp.]